jgi:hypothetical protein
MLLLGPRSLHNLSFDRRLMLGARVGRRFVFMDEDNGAGQCA